MRRAAPTLQQCISIGPKTPAERPAPHLLTPSQTCWSQCSHWNYHQQAPAANGLLGQLKSEAGAVLLGSKLNLLLLPLPLALAAQRAGWPAGAAFVLALLPLCSLAEVGVSVGWIAAVLDVL